MSAGDGKGLLGSVQRIPTTTGLLISTYQTIAGNATSVAFAPLAGGNATEVYSTASGVVVMVGWTTM